VPVGVATPVTVAEPNSVMESVVRRVADLVGGRVVVSVAVTFGACEAERTVNDTLLVSLISSG
jgi:hypothetical protein